MGEVIDVIVINFIYPILSTVFLTFLGYTSSRLYVKEVRKVYFQRIVKHNILTNEAFGENILQMNKMDSDVFFLRFLMRSILKAFLNDVKDLLKYEINNRYTKKSIYTNMIQVLIVRMNRVAELEQFRNSKRYYLTFMNFINLLKSSVESFDETNQHVIFELYEIFDTLFYLINCSHHVLPISGKNSIRSSIIKTSNGRYRVLTDVSLHNPD